MKKLSKDKKDLKAGKSINTGKGKTSAAKRTSKKRIRDDEEDEDFIPLDDDYNTLDIFDDEDEDEF